MTAKGTALRGVQAGRVEQSPGTASRGHFPEFGDERTMLKQRLPVRFMLVCSVAALVTGPVGAAKDDGATGGMTKAERAYLLSELKSSETALLTSITGLTQAQWTFKPSPDAWSVQECAEHLILAEDLIFDEARKTLGTPAVARLPNATSEGDRQIVAQMEDRSKKAKAPKVIQPAGKFPTPESAAQEFKLRRDKTSAYVKTTNDPLRVHVGDGPSGATADVYQFLLELAAHSARHTSQIREVKAETGYPSS